MTLFLLYVSKYTSKDVLNFSFTVAKTDKPDLVLSNNCMMKIF